MKYLSVSQMAKKWGISERSVRNYCTSDRVVGAVLIGKTWAIPEDAPKPSRKMKNESGALSLNERLLVEKKRRLTGGIYSRLQIEFTHTSLSLSGYTIGADNVRKLFEANKVSGENDFSFDELITVVNHFDLLDLMIDKIDAALTDTLIKASHKLLGRATKTARNKPSSFGEYRRVDYAEGGIIPFAEVSGAVDMLFSNYEALEEHSLLSILELMVSFLEIKPFEVGGEIIGRLIAFKECLRFGISPFLIDSDVAEFYLKGIVKWKKERAFLVNAVELAQEKLRGVLESYGITEYSEDDDVN